MPNGLRAGVRVTSLVAEGTDIYAGTDGDGIFRSIDEGNTWQVYGTGTGTATIDLLSIVGSVGLAKTSFPEGYLRSTDGGLHWTLVDSELLDAAGGTNEIFITAGHAFVATNRAGVLRSDDEGMSWKRASSGIFASAVSDIEDAGEAGVFVAIRDRGILRSKDQGETYETVLDYDGTMGINQLGVSGNRIYAASHYDRILRSDDGGDTWLEIEQFQHNMVTLSFFFEVIDPDNPDNLRTDFMSVAYRHAASNYEEN